MMEINLMETLRHDGNQFDGNIAPRWKSRDVLNLQTFIDIKK